MITKLSLWSTDIFIKEIDVSNWPVIEEGQKEPLFLKNLESVKTEILCLADEYINNPTLATTIQSSWLTEGNNTSGHILHSDEEHIGHISCVVWFDGDSDSGGNLRLWDPRWQNPKTKGLTVKDAYQEIAFKKGTMIMFPSDVWHEVTPYYGRLKRRSLNSIVTTQDFLDASRIELTIKEASILADKLGIEYDGTIRSLYKVIRKANES